MEEPKWCMKNLQDKTWHAMVTSSKTTVCEVTLAGDVLAVGAYLGNI